MGRLIFCGSLSVLLPFCILLSLVLHAQGYPNDGSIVLDETPLSRISRNANQQSQQTRVIKDGSTVVADARRKRCDDGGCDDGMGGGGGGGGGGMLGNGGGTGGGGGSGAGTGITCQCTCDGLPIDADPGSGAAINRPLCRKRRQGQDTDEDGAANEEDPNTLRDDPKWLEEQYNKAGMPEPRRFDPTFMDPANPHHRPLPTRPQPLPGIKPRPSIPFC